MSRELRLIISRCALIPTRNIAKFAINFKNLKTNISIFKPESNDQGNFKNHLVILNSKKNIIQCNIKLQQSIPSQCVLSCPAILSTCWSCWSWNNIIKGKEICTKLNKFHTYTISYLTSSTPDIHVSTTLVTQPYTHVKE